MGILYHNFSLTQPFLVKLDFTTVVFCCTTDEKTQTLLDSYSAYLGSLAA